MRLLGILSVGKGSDLSSTNGMLGLPLDCSAPSSDFSDQSLHERTFHVRCRCHGDQAAGEWGGGLTGEGNEGEDRKVKPVSDRGKGSIGHWH